MKQIIFTSLISISLSATVFGQIFTEDFESGQITGEAPAGAPVIRPTTNTATSFTKIVSGVNNTAGGGVGNAVQIYDNDSGAAGLEYDFVGSTGEQLSAFQISFDFSQNSAGAGNSEEIYFGAGEYNGTSSTRMNANARRFFEVRFMEDGTLDIVSSSESSTGNSINLGGNTIQIFVNDYDSQTVTYTSPETSTGVALAANSVAYYLNGTLLLSTTLDTADATVAGTVGTTENNFGRFGWYSGTTAVGNDYIFDNISLSTIPEPSSVTMLIGLGSIALILTRRRRA
jgi:PEP-CTERM putative exosortase interaction domain